MTLTSIQLDAERKQFAEEKVVKERRIADLEEEVTQYRLKNPEKNALKLKSKSDTTTQQQDKKNNNLNLNNFNQGNRSDTLNLLYSVPHTFFNYLFPTSHHKFQTTILNV